MVLYSYLGEPMRKIFPLFSFVVTIALVACSTPTSNSTTDDDDDILSSSGKGKSSSSQKMDSENPADEIGEDCVGEPGKPWDGTTAKDFACGSGTKLNPYIILTAEQLAHLSFVVGAKDENYLDKYYKLGADITLNDGEVIGKNGGLVADSTKLHKWTPIGNSGVAFAGNFDGDGHTVSGMFINTTSTHNGLFGNSSGTIQNFVVENSWVQGGNYTAGIVGAVLGSVSEVENRASVSSPSDYVGGIAGLAKCASSKTVYVKNSKNHGDVKGRDEVGGVMGNSHCAYIDSLYNYGRVEGRNIVGGISGRAGYTYVSSYLLTCKYAENYAEVVGVNNVGGIFGVAGYASPNMSGNSVITTLEFAKNEGNIVGEKSVGGIIGLGNQIKITRATNLASVEGIELVAGIVGSLISSSTTSLYNTGDISGTRRVGGVFGSNSEGVTSSAYSTGKVDGDSLVGLMIGYNYNTTMADYYYLKQGGQEPFGLNNGGGVATPKTAEEMKSQEFAELLGDDFVYDSKMNDGYPVLEWEKD